MARKKMENGFILFFILTEKCAENCPGFNFKSRSVNYLIMKPVINDPGFQIQAIGELRIVAEPSLCQGESTYYGWFIKGKCRDIGDAIASKLDLVLSAFSFDQETVKINRNNRAVKSLFIPRKWVLHPYWQASW